MGQNAAPFEMSHWWVDHSAAKSLSDDPFWEKSDVEGLAGVDPWLKIVLEYWFNA